MGTRADFYLGRGERAEWLGSIAWDGYPPGLDDALSADMTHEQFMVAIGKLSERDDWTGPKDGWPWPWENSRTTDYAYALDDGKVWVSRFGWPWATWTEASSEEFEWDRSGAKTAFPDMTERKNVTYGQRSGVILLTLPKQ